MKLRMSLAACLLAVFASGAFAGSPAVWLPLSMDREWRYVTAGGIEDRETVSALVLLQHGESIVLTHALSHLEGGPESGLVQFYSVAPEGDVYFHGFDRPLEQIGFVYDPPLRLLIPAPAVGVSWQDTVTAIPTYGTEALRLLVEWEVGSAGPITVPAGTFFSYGVGSQATAIGASPSPVSLTAAGWSATGRTYALTGEARAEVATTPVDWWAEGIGRVQYSSSGLFQLVGGTGITAARRSTWGSIKGPNR